MRGWMKFGAGAGIVVLVMVLSGAMLLDRSLDQDRLRRAVIASVEKQSGRTVTLQALRVSLLPSPHVEAQGFTLGNPEGLASDGGDPVMLRLGDVQARIGLWPLLRHVVRLDGLQIRHASLALARDPDGRANWQMHPARAPGRGSASAGHEQPWGVAFDSVLLMDAKVSLRDSQAHRSGAVHVTHLEGSELESQRPALSLAGSHGDAGFTADGTIGPIARLLADDDRSPSRHGESWPVALRIGEQADGRTLAHGSIEGGLTDPRGGRGYDLSASFDIGALGDLNRLFPHAGLPPVQALHGSLHVVDTGRPLLTALQVQAGTTLVHGETLSSWRLSAASPDAPLAVGADGSWQGRTLRLHGTAGTLRTVQAMSGGSMPPATPVQLVLETAGAALQAQGQLGGEGGDLTLHGTAADLRALWASSPGLGPVAVTARVVVQPGRAVQVSNLSLTSDAGDLEGALSLSLHGKPSLSGQLTSNRLDLDRLASGGTGVRAGTAAAPPPPSPAGAVPGARAPVPPVSPVQEDVPWALLHRVDLDLRMRVAALLVDAQTLRGVTAHVALQGGHLLIDPVQAQGSAGPVSARLEADASASPPHLDVTMHPLFLPASALAGWLGQPVPMRGAIELVGTIRAQGETRRALADSASGHVGASMVNGSLDNDALLRLLGRSMPLSLALPKGGTTDLRCLALHARLGDGRASLDTISLRTGRASVDGQGVVGLPDGALDLHLVPFVTLGGAGASLPVRVTGTLRQAHPAFDTSSTDGRTTLVIGPQDEASEGCDAALRAAREDVPGPAPAAAAPGQRHKNPKPLDILRGLGLFR